MNVHIYSQVRVLLRVDSDEQKRDNIHEECGRQKQEHREGLWVSTQAGCKRSEIHLIEPKLQAQK